MKVFEFKADGYRYAYAGNNVDEAKQGLFDSIGEVEIVEIKEVPESEWDKRKITMYPDNDYSAEPYLETIRTLVFESGVLVYTTDDAMF